MTPLSRRNWMMTLGGGVIASTNLEAGTQLGAAASNETFHLGTRRELFVDAQLIDRMVGQARRQLQRPQRTDDVFVHDTPWEGNRTLYYTLFADGERYRMYYRGSQINLSQGKYSIPYNVTCYAESTDGRSWTRPNLGLVNFDGSKNNNIILSGEQCHAFVPFKDPNPRCTAERRYKAIVPIYKPTRGLHVYASADGIRWSPMSQKAVITTGYFDSQNLAFWDARRKLYVVYFRALRGGPNRIQPESHEMSTKDVMVATSPDFLDWSRPRWLRYSEERWSTFGTQSKTTSPYLQLYTNQIQPYARAPHLYVGFPTRYAAGRGELQGLNQQLGSSVPYFGNAYTDGGLMVSRDGERFEFWDEAFFRPGAEANNGWVYGDNFQALGLLETPVSRGHVAAADQPPERELSLYVNEGFWRQCRLRRYRLRLDGFVSATAPLAGGEVITKPFHFEGRQLELNLSTSAVGSVRVEIQDATGTPLPKYALEECLPIFGDRVSRVVRWKRAEGVRELATQPIRLRFVIRDADLFSFRFGSV